MKVIQEGQEFAGYRLLRMIGEGGMGQVFLAEQLRLKRQVAIKLVRLDVRGEASSGSASPAEELTREAQALMALEHPHILALYDAGRQEDLAYLVMPYIPEGSLQEVLRAGPHQRLQLPLQPSEALLYIEQAASALQYAHDRNFIHRDVKPANFLVRVLTRSHANNQATSRLHLFLADFGLSKFLTHSTSTTRLSGTPTYMAPEQFQGHATPASDQYSLAILFYYLLTGDLPFRGAPVELMFKHLHEPPPSVREHAEALPESLARVIQWGMAKAPEERFPSVIGFAEAARDVLIEAGVVPPHDSFPAIAAVRPPERPPEKSGAEARQDRPVEVAPPPTLVTPAAINTDEMKTTRGVVEGATQQSRPAPGNEGSSLPTLAMEKPQRPPRPPAKPDSSSEGQPRRRGRTIVLALLAAIVIIGAVFGAGYFIQQNKGGSTAAQGTQVPTNAPTNTAPPSVTSAPSSPTAIPPATILNNILAKGPIFTVDLTQGAGQWDIQPINPNTHYEIHTPTGALDIVDLSATYNAQKFSMPMAIAVELQAASDQEFDMVLDTTGAGGTHLYYRLQLRGDGPPQAAHSNDNQNFTNDGKGTSTNTAWADGAKHTLMLVFNGKRLLFYIDSQPLLDTAIPQPNSTAALTLGTVNEAKVTGINIYSVP